LISQLYRPLYLNLYFQKTVSKNRFQKTILITEITTTGALNNMASHLAKLDTVVPLRNQRWQEILCRYNIPGSAISLGHIGYSEMASFGVTRAQPTHTTRPYAHNIDSYTVFEAGSLSKPVVSYLIYTLERQGHLRPNTPLVSQLSRKDQQTALFHELSDELSRSRATRITYEMILTHTAGFDGWRADQPLTINAEPGSRFSYSGEGYLLLQRFLELLLQTDIETIMQQYIFGPIGMPA
jgi:CubicO group peptidase (beta-lactamase class C family)